MKIKSLISPTKIILVQYIILIIILKAYDLQGLIFNEKKIINYITKPICIYIVIVLLVKLFDISLKKNNKRELNKSTLKFCEIIVNISSLINIIAILDLIFKYGGVVTFIKKIIFSDLPYLLQRNPTELIGKSVMMLNISMLCLVLILLNRKLYLKRKLKLITLPLIFSTFVLAIVVSMRVLIINMLIPILIIKFSDVKFNIKNLFKIIIIFIIGISFILGMQIVKSNVKNFREASKIVTDYYGKSIYNAYYVIDHNIYGNNPLYWTYRPMFNISGISKIFKIKDKYERKYGPVPINNRDDDFSYVANMGLDARYNTFSLIGYSFLDMGDKGYILILIAFLVFLFLYIGYKNGNIIMTAMYLCAINLMIDQLRTNSIYSIQFIYLVIIGVTIFIFDKIKFKN